MLSENRRTLHVGQIKRPEAFFRGQFYPNSRAIGYEKRIKTCMDYKDKFRMR